MLVTAGIVNGTDAEILNPPINGIVVTLRHHLLENGTKILLPDEKPTTGEKRKIGFKRADGPKKTDNSKQTEQKPGVKRGNVLPAGEKS